MTFRCTLCGKAFNSKSVIKFHIKIAHRNDVKWQCARCGKLFPSKSYVECHEDVCSAVSSIRTDSGECVTSPMSLEEFVATVEEVKCPEASTSLSKDNLPLIEPKTGPKSPKRGEYNPESEKVCTIDLISISSSGSETKRRVINE